MRYPSLHRTGIAQFCFDPLLCVTRRIFVGDPVGTVASKKTMSTEKQRQTARHGHTQNT